MSNITNTENTWCPGCGNFGILGTIDNVLKKQNKRNTVITSGIGCHGKIYDYLNVNGFYSLHGRSVPAGVGIKLANPKLKVISFAGDGDAYGEGLSHLMFAAKRNIDMTVIVHNNRIYGLTTGQYTPTSPMSLKGKSAPRGVPEYPINPLSILLDTGATYVARGYSSKAKELESLINGAIKHKGFSIVDILQPCFTFYNTYDLYNKNTYELSGHDYTSKEKAKTELSKWDYNTQGKISLGLFYKSKRKTYEDYTLGKMIPVNRKRVNKRKLFD